MEIVQVSRASRDQFLELWLEYLKEQHELGSAVLPSYHNALQYGSLLDSYLRGSLFGFGLMGLDPSPCACLLIGESPDNGLSLETTRGRSAILWGVYVLPSHRRRGYARQIQDYGVPLVKELGFKTILSDVLYNEAAEGNAWSWRTSGGNQRYATRVYVRL